ncbi:serine hydrolase domain-containing protein [candidate division KSB1 bacterium]
MSFCRKYFPFLLIIFLLAVFSCQHQQSQPVSEGVNIPTDQPAGHSSYQAAIAQFEATIASDVAEDGTGSISAAVVWGNDIVWSRGFGWADIGRNIPADENTIYRTGSISKSFTAVLMMQVIEKEFFQLDDSVDDYFPAIGDFKEKPEGAEPITFRQLASHTAGIIREPRLEGAASGPIEEWEERVLASIPHTYYQSLPGERYSYSNIGFGILGLATSRIADEPFMDLVKTQIFDPLKMESSFFIIPAGLYENVSMGYSRRRDGSIDGESPAKEHSGRGYKVPNGGIYSTVLDLSKFVSAMTGSAPVNIFSEETRLEILKRQTPEGGGGYGLGFSISTDDDGFTTIGHGGSVAGYNAHMVFDPVSKLGVTLLRNYSGGSTNLSRAARGLLKKLVEAGK